MGMAGEASVTGARDDNVSQFPDGSRRGAAGSPGNGGFGERLARIEAQLDSIKEHGATKDDISKVKIWFLAGVLAAIGLAIPAAIGVAFAVARLFSIP